MESDVEMVSPFLSQPCAEVSVVQAGEDWENLPFVEKYRPNSLDDIISHFEIIDTSKSGTVTFSQKVHRD